MSGDSTTGGGSNGTHRRGVLTTLGTLAVSSGCLRLTSNAGTSNAGTTTTASGTPSASDAATRRTTTETSTDSTSETSEGWSVELTPEWSRHLEPSEYVLDDDALYVGDSGYTSDLGVLAVSVADGSRRWTVSAPYRTRSLALADDGTLYAGVGQVTEEDGSLYAIDSSSGSADSVFDVELSPTKGPAMATSDTVVFGTEFHQEGETHLYGLARDDHDTRWSKTADDGGYTGGVLADGTAYLGGFGYGFAALDPETGERAWRRDWQLAPDTDPVVHDGSLFFVDARREGLRRLNRQTGEEEWNHGVERDVTTISHLSGPVFGDDTAYFTVGEYVYAVRVGGQRRWSVELPQPVRYSPALVDGVLWIATQDTDVLRGLDPATGETLFRTQLPADTDRTVAAGETLLVFLNDRVLAFTVETP